MLAEWVVRALRKLRPREGWLTLSTMLLISLSLPLSLVEARWVPGARGLLLLAPLATFVSLRMTTFLSAAWAVPLSLAGGVFLIVSADRQCSRGYPTTLDISLA